MGTGAGQDHGGICTAARIDLKEHRIDRQCRPQPGATLPALLASLLHSPGGLVTLEYCGLIQARI